MLWVDDNGGPGTKFVAKEVETLWVEYEQVESPEALFVFGNLMIIRVWRYAG